MLALNGFRHCSTPSLQHTSATWGCELCLLVIMSQQGFACSGHRTCRKASCQHTLHCGEHCAPGAQSAELTSTTPSLHLMPMAVLRIEGDVLDRW